MRSLTNIHCCKMIDAMFVLSWVFAALMVLQACALSTPRSTERGLEQLMEPEMALISRTDIIEHYRYYLEFQGEGVDYCEAVRRLADLELESAEEFLISSDIQSQHDARQLIDSAVEHYKTYLKSNTDNESVYYHLFKAYTLTGQARNALDISSQYVERFPQSELIDEIYFRRGELLFTLSRFAEAAHAYDVVTTMYGQSRFHEKSLYKLGWSQYKLNNIHGALNHFVRLLDNKLPSIEAQYLSLPENLQPSERELVRDLLHAATLAFYNSPHADDIAAFFSKSGTRAYETLLYGKLIAMYLGNNRTSDAEIAYMSHMQTYGNDPSAWRFSKEMIELFTNYGDSDLLLLANRSYATYYGVNSQYWQSRSEDEKKQIRPALINAVQELAAHYHADVRKNSSIDSVRQASHWYKAYINWFPERSDVTKVNFLLAEMLFDAGQFMRAVDEYEATAYFSPAHVKAVDAGYAALLCYQKMRKTMDAGQWVQWRQRYIDSSLKYVETFPHSSNISGVLVSVAEELYATGDYQRAIEIAQRVVNIPLSNIVAFKQTAQAVIAHARFALEMFAKAEKEYTQLLRIVPVSVPLYQTAADRLVDSIYRQGVRKRDEGDYAMAAHHFARVGRLNIQSTLILPAVYDSGVMYMKMLDWNRAIVALEDFRARFPNDKQFKRGVMENLAMAYGKTAQRKKAAEELLALAEKYGDATYQKDMLWLAADMYFKAGDDEQAASVYKTFVNKNAASLTESVEALYFLAEHALASGSDKTQNYWLTKIIKRDNRAGKTRTASSTLYAARAALKMAHSQRKNYQAVKLASPLKKSLRKKMTMFKNTLKSYEEAMAYEIEAVFTEATVSIAEMYEDFARALLNSEKPVDLSVAEMEQYTMMLEDQAFPFEEKAISYHELNIRQTGNEVYDASIVKSYHALSRLVPARYGKVEKVAAYILPIN